MSLFRPAIERSLLWWSRWETEKNLSRLASNWRDRVAKGINKLTRQAEQQALDELAALEHTLKQSASKAPELKQVIDELEQTQKRLHESQRVIYETSTLGPARQQVDSVDKT